MSRTFAYLKNGEEIKICDVPEFNREKYYDSPKSPRKELIAKKGRERQHHFAEYNCNGMTEWHKKWQKYCKYEGFELEVPIENRKLDAVWEYNNTKICVEFQNSQILQKELEKRDSEYRESGYSPLWLINCTSENDIIEEKENFFALRHPLLRNLYEKVDIFIDTIYGIARVNTVQGRIYIPTFKTSKQFINDIKRATIFDWEKYTNKARVIIQPEGAGSGKTFKETEEIKSGGMEADYAIYLTPQHSQKHEASYKLLQHKQEKWKTLENSQQFNINDTFDHIVYQGLEDGKYRMFGTIDSYIRSIWSLFPKDVISAYNFKNTPYEILHKWDEIKQRVKNAKNLKWASWPFDCSKNVIIICDEVQNIQKEKIFILLKLCELIPTWSLRCVGDLLQSTLEEDNILNHINKNESILKSDFPLIHFEFPEKKNDYKRGQKNPKLAEFINKVVGPDFEKYKLPKISINNTNFKGSDIDVIEYKDEEQLCQGLR